MKGYEEASTTARLVWERRDDPKMPRRLTAGHDARRSSSAPSTTGSCPTRPPTRYAAALPNAELVRIPGTGHALVVEQPAAVAKAILDFQERAR